MDISRIENSKTEDFSVPSFNGSIHLAAGVACRRKLWRLGGSGSGTGASFLDIVFCKEEPPPNF